MKRMVNKDVIHKLIKICSKFASKFDLTHVKVNDNDINNFLDGIVENENRNINNIKTLVWSKDEKLNEYIEFKYIDSEPAIYIEKSSGVYAEISFPKNSISLDESRIKHIFAQARIEDTEGYIILLDILNQIGEEFNVPIAN